VRGDLLDLILIGLMLAFAVSGYRHGFIIGAFSLIGFVGGAVLGLFIAPPIAGAIVSGDTEKALLALVIVFLAATIGQFAFSTIGAVVSSHVTREPARLVDALGGSVASGLSVLLIAWLLGSLMVSMRLAVVKDQVNGSFLWRTVDEVIPNSVRALQKPVLDFIDSSEWHDVITSIGGHNVPPPNRIVTDDSQIKRARRAIVKVQGTAPSCDKRVEGTGFVYARHRVMTNAHVVAGVTQELRVTDASGASHEARVVLYNPERDIAVLYVPDLNVGSLRFDYTAESRDDAIIAGFPKGRGYTVEAARIRVRLNAQSYDIYNRQKVERDVYAIRGRVQPGNSGGPLLTTDGRVYGVIFAAATDQKETGYALTAEEVRGDAQGGAATTAKVDTQECD
jgi:S1-C subfamily serine protease